MPVTGAVFVLEVMCGLCFLSMQQKIYRLPALRASESSPVAIYATTPIGDTLSEVLTLGVQYPKAESGEATFITPVAEAKIGGKLF